jgi:DNA polymerase-3 subunit beta
MKFVCERDALNRSLRLIAGRARSKTQIPILHHILFEADMSSISATATDMDTMSEASCKAEVSRAGSSCLPADRIVKLVELMPTDSQIEFDLNGTEMMVRCGKSRYKLPVLPADDFCKMSAPDDPVSFTLDCASAKTLFATPLTAVEVSNPRVYLAGCFLHCPKPGRLAITGTDGKTLIRLAVETECGLIDGIIVPPAAVNEIVKLCAEGDADFVCGKNKLSVKASGCTFTTKLIDGTYPEVERLIPADTGKFIAVDRADLYDAIARLSGIKGEFSTIDLSWSEGTENLSVTLDGEGSGAESIACSCDLEAGNISFMPDILSEMLGAMHCEIVQLHITGPGRVMRLVDPNAPDLIVLAMPCSSRSERISNRVNEASAA